MVEVTHPRVARKSKRNRKRLNLPNSVPGNVTNDLTSFS